MEPDPAPAGPQVETPLTDLIVVEAGPAQIAAATALTLGLILLPVLVLLSALLKLRRSPEHRTLHVGLALAAGLAVLLSALTALAPRAIPDAVRDTGILSFTWVFLFAWMALDFTRSARATALRPRGSDIAVLLCAGATAVALATLFLS
jgi:hypothetical protein